MHNIRTFSGIAPLLGEGIYIDPQATVIGDVRLANDVSVWPMAVIRGDVNYISIGEACNIQDGAILHVTHDGPYTPGGQPLILAKGVTIGHKAVLHACQIDNFCLIGINAVILDKVHIEHHVMVAAGSIVPPGKRLQSGYLYLGNPARAVRPLTADEMANLEYSAEHYVQLKNKYL
ncbi:gamma carbonic anhydrase family protein [Legionella jordanis]|uniref:Transferase n=1 Tax=Legionella jordanis TaxID=456 RepID=A0A0W0VBE3_9GAMM|nr:gamma carbonic anhydrase family protein [Legionella jordanis]KTD17431.1 transferase [Legionella jordanis]RMX01805.1 gamma carbonic anhydrase family protein [Legionella jordanis]VEH11547.1 transferase [Legionella jordanis]